MLEMVACRGHEPAEPVRRDDGDPVFTIGELAREFDVTLRALRFYEDKNLLHPKRRGTTRLYAPRDRVRLQIILWGKRMGLSLAEIKTLLELYHEPDGKRRQLVYVQEKLVEQKTLLHEQKLALEQQIDEVRNAIEEVGNRLKAIG